MRSCDARAEGGVLRLRVSGPGWVWVDQQGMGFRVQQSVFFYASAEMSGALSVGYDPAARRASLWVSPIEVRGVTVAALGEVNTRPETLGALLINAVLPSLPRGEAREKVASTGASRFREAILRGATVIYDVRRQQVDVELGHLPPGQGPPRPFQATSLWWSNERVRVHADAPHVLGPFEAGVANVTLRTERGAGVVGRAVCRADLREAVDGMVQGRPVRWQPGAVFQELAPGPEVHAAVRPPCSWYLLLNATSPWETDVAVFIAPTGESSPVVTTMVPVRVTSVSYEVAPTKRSGKPWDEGMPAPDVRLSLRAGDLTWGTQHKNNHRGSFLVPGHRVFFISRQTPLEVRLVDADLMFDDSIGSGTVTVTMAEHGGEVEVPIVDGFGWRAATVRLQLEVVAPK
ncbi:MAG: hypothetical protein R3B72_51655 [Polyangiaceae bacterium]